MLVNACTTVELKQATSSRGSASIRGRVGNHARCAVAVAVAVPRRTSARKRSIGRRTYASNIRSSVSGLASSSAPARIAGGKEAWNVQSVHAQVKPYRSRRNV